MGQQDASKRPD